MSKLETAVNNNSIPDNNDRMIKARNITIIGLVINVLLAVFKITISIRSGSLSLLADGLDSALDIATVIFGFVAIRIANRPADKDHHFGHAKFENFFSLGVALLLVASSGIIGYQAITKLIDAVPSVYDPYNLIIAAISIVLKGVLVWLNVSVGKKIESPILVANGKNFRTDILTSIVVLVSVSIGHRSIGSFSLFWVDPTIAIIIGIIIIITAIGIVKDSAGVLLDQSPDEETMSKIEKYTKEKTRSVLLAEDISENQHEIFSKLQYLADLNAEKTEEPIATIIMTGTSEYFQALTAVLPQIADRSEPIDVPRFEWKHSREFIGRRIAYAKGEISSFDIDDFSIYPFEEDAAKILADSSRGIPRDLRLLCRAAVSVTADALLRKEGKGEITYDIAKVVSEYYRSFLSDV